MKKILGLSVFILFLSACFKSEKDLGSISNPVVIGLSKPYFENLSSDELKKFENSLKELTGINVVVEGYDNSIDIIKKFGNKKVDFAFLTINEYLIAREDYRVKPVLKVVRRGNETEYYSVITTLNKEIKTLKDINGKKFCSRSVYSISSFVLPSILFIKGGINPSFVFSNSYEESYKLLKEGKVDVASFYKDFVSQHKDLNVIYEIGPIPNESVVVRNGVKEDVILKIKNGLYEMSKRYPDILKKMADINGFTEANLKDYAEIHKIIRNYSKGIYSLVPDGIEIRKLNEEYNFN